MQMQTLRDLDSYWQANYGLCPPDLVYHEYPDRWVRFHSLPESKRYPDGEAEYQCVLGLHNAILSEISAPGEDLWLISTGHSSTPTPIRDNEALAHFDPAAQFWRSIARHKLEGDEDNPNYEHLFVSRWPWEPGIFDWFIRLVANEEVTNAHIVNQSAQTLFHPYDGGADIILRTTSERDRLKQTFHDWLSPREDGL